jgi:hypothetical protein
MMESRHPTYKEIDELVSFLPGLYADGFTPIDGWGGGTTNQDGVFTVSWPTYSPLVKNFFRLAAKKCWCDYQYRPEEAERMLHDDNVINGASLAQIKTMLTYCVRGERFGDGHWAMMIEQGHIRRLLQRLCEIQSADVKKGTPVQKTAPLTLKVVKPRVADTNNASAPKKAAHTDRWTETMFRALVARVADRWRLVSFRGKNGGEWCGIVDVIAIRKNTSKTSHELLKSGDLFDIVLVQMKGGSASMPNTDDKERLRAVATHYGAKEIVLFEWKRGKRSAFSRLTSKGTWDPSSARNIFGPLQRKANGSTSTLVR